MTPEYILRKSLCREAHCSDASVEARASVIENLQYAPAYAEPGYTNPAKGILLTDWNYFSGDVTSLLEKYGYEIEWEDEWSTCEDCGKLVRTSPDSYGWQASYAVVGGSLLCHECLEADPTEYLADLENEPTHAVTLQNLKLEEHGYKLLQTDFEAGLHPGQTDDPKKIYAKLRAEGHDHILFRIESVGQFDLRFSVWEREEKQS